jgi:hypothetical protein
MRFVVIFLASAVVLGCDRATVTSPSTSNAVDIPTSQSLVIAGASTLTQGVRTQLRALAVGPDGATKDVTSEAVWSVDNPLVAIIESNGWITGVKSGGTQVSARRGKTEANLALTVNAIDTVPTETGQPPSPNTPPGEEPPGNTPPGSMKCLPPPLPPDLPEPVLPCPTPLSL